MLQRQIFQKGVVRDTRVTNADHSKRQPEANIIFPSPPATYSKDLETNDSFWAPCLKLSGNSQVVSSSAWEEATKKTRCQPNPPSRIRAARVDGHLLRAISFSTGLHHARICTPQGGQVLGDVARPKLLARQHSNQNTRDWVPSLWLPLETLQIVCKPVRGERHLGNEARRHIRDPLLPLGRVKRGQKQAFTWIPSARAFKLANKRFDPKSTPNNDNILAAAYSPVNSDPVPGRTR